MNLRVITSLILLLFTVNISTTSKANTDTIVIEGATKIIEGLGKIETATKGKKLQKFFSGNTLRLLIDEKTKEYKFQEKTYEVFEDGKSIESGKWKVSGLLKNQIKLNADGNSKAYYLKKINKKEILYHYDKAPGKEGTIKTLVTIEPLIKKEETKVVKKKEEPKVEETKVVKKKEEPKVEETKVVKKKEEPKVDEPKIEETKVVKKKTKKISQRVKNKDKIKTKEDLEAFLIGKEIKYSSMYEGKNYINTTKYDFDGKGYVIGSGMKQDIIWEAIDGNSIKAAYVQNMWWGWSTRKLNYDNLTYTVTSEKTYDEKVGEMVDKISVYNGKILSPTIFAKKELKKREVATVIPDGQIIQILQVNCNGGFVGANWGFGTTYEIDFDGGYIYTTFSERMNPKGNKQFKSKDKIISYDNNKLTAFGSPYLTDKDIGKYKIEYTFNYRMMDRTTADSSTVANFVIGVVKGKEYVLMNHCYRTNYLADKSNIDKTLKTYANSDGYPEEYNFEKGNESFQKDLEISEKKRTAELEKQMAKINKQISSEYNDSMKNLKMKSNKYGSSQLEQTKKIVNSVTKEDFKTYNVTSLISYYFFDSMSNYLESLEFLYRAYDKNADADKLKAQIAYLKSSKGSEKERLESTKQIISSASLEVQADVQDESIVLSDEAKINYQKALPFAFKATDSGYKLFVVSKGLVTEIKGSGNLLGTLLKNANELQGAATVVPLIPDYIKKVGGTAKLIFSGAKTKKIKDKENLSAALDELDLSA